MTLPLSRRRFLGAVAGGAAIGKVSHARGATRVGDGGAKPAVLGGAPVRKAPFPAWPVRDATEDQALGDVVRSGRWNRGPQVERFEAEYARLTGAAHCLATANGTSALLATLGALDVGPGDEVIVPPYTFVATINAVLLRHALPVFVDTDVETFQIDARKIAAAITERTRVVMPVHLGGAVADLDTILAAAAPRGCQWSKMPVRRTWRNGRGARWARMAGQAASVSRPARTSTAPRAAPFSPTTPNCWKPATGSTTTAVAGPPPAAPISRIAASARTCGSPNFRLPCFWRR